MVVLLFLPHSQDSEIIIIHIRSISSQGSFRSYHSSHHLQASHSPLVFPTRPCSIDKSRVTHLRTLKAASLSIPATTQQRLSFREAHPITYLPRYSRHPKQSSRPNNQHTYIRNHHIQTTHPRFDYQTHQNLIHKREKKRDTFFLTHSLFHGS